MVKHLKPADLSRIRTVPLAGRRSLVEVAQFARRLPAGATVGGLVDALPRILAGEDLRGLVEALAEAAVRGRMVLACMGGHVIKCGLSPVVIELMERGVIRAVAMNGAAAIHDYEIALVGSTSEDVARALDGGEFGFAEETGRGMNEAINTGAERGMGMGDALGRAILEGEMPYTGSSILAAAARMGLPATVHVAIGTDIIHQHPAASGGATGETSLQDFRLLVSVAGELASGSVVMNIGSAVILPEVFLKAVSTARNLGRPARGFTAANLDFIQHYRPVQNFVRRPTGDGGRGICLTGHHEILIPLIAAAVLERLGEAEGR